MRNGTEVRSLPGKVDLDVVNEKNSLLEKTTHVREIAHPWLDEDWGPTTRQQFIESRYIETENESRLNYPPNFQGAFVVVNKDELNGWDVPRGYGIHAGANPIFNVRRILLLHVRFSSFVYPLLSILDCRWIETDA